MFSDKQALTDTQRTDLLIHQTQTALPRVRSCRLAQRWLAPNKSRAGARCQVGQGFGHPGLVESDPARDRGLE